MSTRTASRATSTRTASRATSTRTASRATSTRAASRAAEGQIIGRVTRYHGDEHPYLLPCDVRIVAILHLGNTAPDADGEIRGYERLESDDEIAHYGGVTANDRVEVAPFSAREGRFSWVTSDPRAIDLACFGNLAGNR